MTFEPFPVPMHRPEWTTTTTTRAFDPHARSTACGMIDSDKGLPSSGTKTRSIAPPAAADPGACSLGRYTRIGLPPVRNTSSAVLPSTARMTPDRPCEVMATSVPGTRSASWWIACATFPCTSVQMAWAPQESARLRNALPASATPSPSSDRAVQGKLGACRPRDRARQREDLVRERRAIDRNEDSRVHGVAGWKLRDGQSSRRSNPASAATFGLSQKQKDPATFAAWVLASILAPRPGLESGTYGLTGC